MMDGFGNKDSLQFRFWMNSRSTRVYLLQGVKQFLEPGYPSIAEGDFLEVGKCEVDGGPYYVLVRGTRAQPQALPSSKP